MTDEEIKDLRDVLNTGGVGPAVAKCAASAIEQLIAERDAARARVEISVRILSGIHALLSPPHISTPDGKTWAFRPKSIDPHEILQELSDRIRAIPDKLKAELSKILDDPIDRSPDS